MHFETKIFDKINVEEQPCRFSGANDEKFNSPLDTNKKHGLDVEYIDKSESPLEGAEKLIGKDGLMLTPVYVQDNISNTSLDQTF